MADYINDPRIKNIPLVRWNDALDRPSLDAQELALRVMSQAALIPDSVAEMKSNGAIFKVAKLMLSESEVVQMYACWFISNMCSGDDEQVRLTCYKAGILDNVAPILHSDNQLLLEKAFWVLTNLGLNDYIREKMIAGKIVVPYLLRAVIKSEGASAKAAALRPLINLAFDEASHEQVMHSEAIKECVGLLSSENSVAQQIALTLLYFLTPHSDNIRIALVSKLHVLKPLVAILEAQESAAAVESKSIALRLLTNLSTSDANEKEISKSGILLAVVDSLASSHADLQISAAMLLANLCYNPVIREEIRLFGWAEAAVKMLANKGDAQVHALRFTHAISLDGYCRKLLVDAGAVPKVAGLANAEPELADLAKKSRANLSLPIPQDVLDQFKVVEVEVSVPTLQASDSVSSVNSFFLGEQAKPGYTLPPSGAPSTANPTQPGATPATSASPSGNKLPEVIPVRKATIRRDPADAPLYARRERVAKELLDTEKTYVAALETIKIGFLGPLRQAAKEGKPILTDVEIHKLFSVSELLHQIHSAFLGKLQTRLGVWRWDLCVADLFLELTEMLKAYKPYINNYDVAIEFFSTQAVKRKNWVAFMAAMSDKYPELRGAGLSHFLIQPIQRLPRYMLLLDQLLKFTPPHHIDHRNLDIAFNKVKKITEYLNEAKRNAESSNKIMEIEISLTGLTQQLMVLGRRFLKDGSLLEERKGGSRYLQLFLFNDILLLTTPEKKLRRAVSTTKAVMEKNKDKDKKPRMFKVIRVLTLAADIIGYEADARDTKFKLSYRPAFEADGEGILQLVAPTPEERTAWMTTLQKTTKEAQSSPALEKRTTASVLDLKDSEPLGRSPSKTSVGSASAPPAAAKTPVITVSATQPAPQTQTTPAQAPASPSTLAPARSPGPNAAPQSAQSSVDMAKQMADLQQQMEQMQNAFKSSQPAPASPVQPVPAAAPAPIAAGSLPPGALAKLSPEQLAALSQLMAGMNLVPGQQAAPSGQ